MSEVWTRLRDTLLREEEDTRVKLEAAIARRKEVERLMAQSGIPVLIGAGAAQLPKGMRLPSYTFAAQQVLRTHAAPMRVKELAESMWVGLGYSQGKKDRKDFENNLRSSLNDSIRKKHHGIFTAPDPGYVGLTDWKREPVDLMRARRGKKSSR